jgi:hypothetical protein
MHPILDSRLRFALYLVAWLIVALLIAGVFAMAGVRPLGEAFLFAAPLAILYSNVCLSVWYQCRGLPLGRTPALRVLINLGGGALLASALLAGVGALWSAGVDRLVGPALVPNARVVEASTLLVAGVPLYLLSAVVHYLMLAFEDARAAERRAFESQVAARDAELKALRAQLHPHFLFNSLNSINALVGSDPEGARRMCEGLGDFFRRTLNLAGRDTVPLEEELALVERYLGVEQVRFGARLRVERHVPADAARCLVPPLLLQPLVENAVKHGVAERLEGGVIGIRARRAEGVLELMVENPLDEDAKSRRGEGHGLENVRRRLEAMGSRHTRLEARREAGRFVVTLTLPAAEAAR